MMRFITALAEARSLQTECQAPLKIVARTPDTQVCTAMPMAVYITVLAIVFGFAVPASAEDRPSDPFGNHTIELNKEAPLVSTWEYLKDQVLLDKARFHSCIEFSNASCPELSALMKIVEEARQNQGKALLGHLGISINLMIKPVLGDWTSPLEDHDEKWRLQVLFHRQVCGSSSGWISPDHVRLVIVHNRRHN
jgi:hypothetical protein